MHEVVKSPAQAQSWDLNPGSVAVQCCVLPLYCPEMQRRVCTATAVAVLSPQAPARDAWKVPAAGRRPVWLYQQTVPKPEIPRLPRA